MTNIETFLAMGGYGAFVWPAFGLTAAIMLYFAVTSLRTLRQRERALQALEAQAGPRTRRAAGSGGEVAP